MRRTHLLPAAAVAVGALLAACGDDAGDADEGSAVIVTTTGAPTATDPTTTTPPSATATTGTPTTAPSTDAAPTSAAATTAPPTTVAPTTPPPMGDPAVALVDVADLDQTVDVAWRPDDPTLFVVEQAGRVAAVDPDTGEARTVLDATDLTEAQGEQGLLGLAISPAGDRAYVNFIDDAGDTVIAELAVAADGTFDRGSLRVVMQVDQPYGNHNGGDLAFGPDGLLYIGLGDGGSAGDPERRALDLSTPLGKLLRIDPTPSGDLPYTIPDDNPFVGVDGARGEIFAVGLRNPWKFTFDPLTDDLWIADVGQNRLEEVNHVPAPTDGTVAGRGLSFGWSAFEGTDRFNDDVSPDGHVGPVLTYEHGEDGCSISGGAPYRGTAIPELTSGYVYTDYCSGTLWALDLAGGRNLVLAELGQGATAVVAGPDGELYVTSATGPLRRIVAAS